jgi:hypothetical protein
MLTATVLTPGVSSAVYTYTQTIHKTTNETQYTEHTYIIRIHTYNNKNTQYTKLTRSVQNRQPYIKVKESRYRPGVAQRVPGGLGSPIFMTFGT